LGAPATSQLLGASVGASVGWSSRQPGHPASCLEHQLEHRRLSTAITSSILGSKLVAWELVNPSFWQLREKRERNGEREGVRTRERKERVRG